MSFHATVFWTENQSRSNCNVDFFENKREKWKKDHLFRNLGMYYSTYRLNHRFSPFFVFIEI